LFFWKGELMSAPDTNVKSEEKKHRPALIGIKATLVYAAILLVGLVGWTFLQSDGPDGAQTQIDGRTGEEMQTN
jgi:hypothetical protein